VRCFWTDGDLTGRKLRSSDALIMGGSTRHWIPARLRAHRHRRSDRARDFSLLQGLLLGRYGGAAVYVAEHARTADVGTNELYPDNGNAGFSSRWQ